MTRNNRDIRDRLMWRLVALMLIVLVGWLTVLLFQQVGEREAAEEELARMQAEREAAPEAPAPAARPRALGLSTFGIRQLEQAGLGDDPEQGLLDDLQGRPDLIPEEPVLGGTHYFVAEEMAVLNDHWVYAVFEDGHIRGAAIFAFEVDGDGAIRWEAVLSRVEG
ncbi:hypothetical protein ACN2MM_08015 [Alkalilimnicola ehrlichii MLHE-1]|uniref:hypothetical protein n=1 Tax=Alkalilimnicola ehrlichii TaxID=351052 RepID=UPI0012EA7007|nr:hypothetical protein [Alkalilimnicola ehrlichii]